MKVNGQEFDQNGRESSTFMQRFTLISVDVHLNLTIELDYFFGKSLSDTDRALN